MSVPVFSIPVSSRSRSPFSCRRRGVEMKIVAGERQPTPDQAMIRALRNAHRWADMLKAGTALKDIADRDGFPKSYVARFIPLAMLSPKIQDAIPAISRFVWVGWFSVIR